MKVMKIFLIVGIVSVILGGTERTMWFEKHHMYFSSAMQQV
jgi:hypothetical protein